MRRRELVVDLIAIPLILLIALVIMGLRSTSRSAPDSGIEHPETAVATVRVTARPEPSEAPSSPPIARPSLGSAPLARSGVIAWAGEALGHDYLAIPIGPGWIVELRGPGGCRVMSSTDAGPNRAMLEAGRIADVAVGAWEELAGADRSTGLFRGSWRTLARLDEACRRGA